MAGIDLLALEPTKISRNLRGKFLLVYGLPKTGKTTLLSKLPHSLILAFEAGTNALNNAYVQPIKKWTDAKAVLRELKKEAVQEKFHFIGVDTADIAWGLCEKYICQQNQVQNLAEIPWGKGYALCKQEFEDYFRDIAQLGYGICFVSHSTEKTMKDEKGNDYISLAPALPSRPYDIVNKMVDIIGYIRAIKDNETGESKTYIFLRGDDRFIAGSRFKYIEPRIEFNYESLAEAIYTAIDKQVEADGTGAATEEYNPFYKKEEERSFEEIRDEAKELWDKLVTQTNSEENAQKISFIIEKTFGRKMKLSDITESQKDLFELVVSEIKRLVK
jgi:hypothetical protein